jgi:hypothetical protein
VVKVSTLAFWDAYLKADAKARNSLQSSEVVKPFADAASIRAK